MNQAEKTRQTKQKIREAALRLFKKKGFNETSIKDICAASGYSIGAFYHHFNSKASILDDAYSEFDAYIEADFDADQYQTAQAAIKAIIAAQSHRIATADLDIVKSLFREQLSFGQQFIVNKHRFELTSLVKLVADGQTRHEFRPDLQPVEIAASIFRLSVGDIYMWCLDEGNFDLEQTVAFDLKLLLDSIAVK